MPLAKIITLSSCLEVPQPSELQLFAGPFRPARNYYLNLFLGNSGRLFKTLCNALQGGDLGK